MHAAGGLPRTIAIDGPVASGKSTVGRAVAAELAYLFLDTGLLYRAVAWLALEHGVATDDGSALAALVARQEIDVVATPGTPLECRVMAGHRDVTELLATSQIDAAASIVSAHPEVRAALLPHQRRVASRGAVVMAGRDIGTVVLPHADLKVYLNASPEARARRRLAERSGGGHHDDFHAVLAAVLARDARDAGRSAAPLAVAADADVVDTDPCDLPQVVAYVLWLVRRWPDRPRAAPAGSAPCAGGPAGGTALP
jgi:cytidylate kinase